MRIIKRITKGKGLIDILDKLKKEKEEKKFLDIDYLMEMTINIMYYFERINEYEIKKIELKYDNNIINDYINEIIPFILNEINFYVTDLKNYDIIKKYKKIKDGSITFIKIEEADFSAIEALCKKCLSFLN